MFERVLSRCQLKKTGCNMRKNRSVYYMSDIIGSGLAVRVAVYGVLLAVILCGGCSDSAIGTVVGESKVPAVPSAPSNVSVSTVSSSVITVSWPSVSHAVGYKVYRYDEAVATLIANTSYTDAELSSGTRYRYKVSAYNEGGESPVSPEVFAMTKPGALSVVTASAVSLDNITVSWQAVSGADGYYVYRDINPNGRYSDKVGTTSSTSYINNKGVLPSTIYYYRVSAYNSGGEGVLSPYDSAITVPSVPSNVSATMVSSSSISISWPPSFGAVGYKVYRDGEMVESVSDTSYTDTDLTLGTYHYEVSAYNDIGESAKSLPLEAALIDIPVVTVTAESSSSINVSWTSVSGGIGYYVYRSTNADGPYSKVKTISSLSYTDIGLSSCTVYYYKVSAYGNTGEGDKSSFDSASTRPNPPTGISATAASSNSIVVSWFASQQATKYNVYGSTSPNGNYTLLGSATSESYKDNGLLSCNTYYYKVSVYSNSCGESELSLYIEAKPLPATQNVYAKAVSSSAIAVNWSQVCGAEGYFVNRSTSATGTYSRVRATSSTSYTDPDLQPNTNYCYKITYSGNGGEIAILTTPTCAMTPPRYVTDTITDERDGKIYTTVKIDTGKVWWMTKNLNYEFASRSWCYEDDEPKCDTYGRLYDWTTATEEEICPEGWRLPSRQEWADLAKSVGGTGTYGTAGTAGTVLKHSTGWTTVSGTPVGTNNYGFSALPGGYKNTIGEVFSDLGIAGYWWTATENGDDNAYSRSMKNNSVSVVESNDDKTNGMSVRCVQDD